MTSLSNTEETKEDTKFKVPSLSANNDINTQNSNTSSKKSSRVVLSVKLDGHGEPLLIKVKRTTHWTKVFDAFARSKGLNVSLLLFHHDGQRINAQQTETVAEVRFIVFSVFYWYTNKYCCVFVEIYADFDRYY